MTNELTAESLNVLSNDISSIIKTSGEIIIDDDNQMSSSSDNMKILKGLLKKVDVDEKSYTKPLNDTLKKIRLQFKPLKETITMAIDSLKIKQTHFLTEKRRQEQIEADRRKKEFEERALEQAETLENAGMSEASESLLSAASEINPVEAKVKSTGNYSSTSIRRSINYNVVDKTKVSHSFLMVDDRAVKLYISTVRDELKKSAKENGLSDEQAADYIYDNIKKADISGIEIVINETVVTR